MSTMTECEMNNEIREKSIAHLTDARRHFTKQQEAEPVAWLCKSKDGQVDAAITTHQRDTYARVGREILPLYLHPPKPAAQPQAGYVTVRIDDVRKALGASNIPDRPQISDAEIENLGEPIATKVREFIAQWDLTRGEHPAALRRLAEACEHALQGTTISGYTCTVPDDCETLYWRGQILSMNEMASVAKEVKHEN